VSNDTHLKEKEQTSNEVLTHALVILLYKVM